LIYSLRLAYSPARLLAPLIDQKVPTLLVCGEDEARAPKLRTPHVLERMVATGSSRFVEIPDLNHGLLHATSRQAVRAVVTSYLTERFGESAHSTSRAVPGNASTSTSLTT
jgi:alpha-beta hydrolase superfamily lysophospholipase